VYKDHLIVVAIPAYNEEVSIGQVIESMPVFVDQVIVVNDGSKDKTSIIAQDKGAIVINHKQNKGIGAAFRTGVQKVLTLDADILVTIDADMQFNPTDIHKLVDPIVENRADFVTASRFKNPAYYPKMTKARFLGNKFMSFLVSRITKQKYFDVSCGFRAYSREALLRLNLFAEFTYTHEAFLDLAFKNLQIVEVPIVVKGTREFGKSRIAANLFKYGYNTFKIVMKTFRDYRPFQLFRSVSLLSFLIGSILALFLLVHYLKTGTFSPHKWAGFMSGSFLVFSLLILAIGFVVDMLARIRYNQEEILYTLKKNLDRKNHKNEEDRPTRQT